MAPRVLVHSSNVDLERELLAEELEAEREPPVPIEVTEIKQWYAMETEGRVEKWASRPRKPEAVVMLLSRAPRRAWIREAVVMRHKIVRTW